MALVVNYVGCDGTSVAPFYTNHPVFTVNAGPLHIPASYAFDNSFCTTPLPWYVCGLNIFMNESFNPTQNIDISVTVSGVTTHLGSFLLDQSVATNGSTSIILNPPIKCTDGNISVTVNSVTGATAGNSYNVVLFMSLDPGVIAFYPFQGNGTTPSLVFVVGSQLPPTMQLVFEYVNTSNAMASTIQLDPRTTYTVDGTPLSQASPIGVSPTSLSFSLTNAIVDGDATPMPGDFNSGTNGFSDGTFIIFSTQAVTPPGAPALYTGSYSKIPLPIPSYDCEC